MATHNETGKKGEVLAAKYLEEKGYEIKATNYRWKRYEIDLVAYKHPFMVFVEVKTKTNISFGYPEDDVTPKKAAQVTAAAEAYLEAFPWKGPIRFDIVAITIIKESSEIEHLEDAFY
jgi:putative endonuclease